MVHWQGKAENPLSTGQAGLGMLKHITVSGTFALCKDIVDVSFGGNGVLGMGLHRDRVSLIHSCRDGNVTSPWCHLEPEILPWLCHHVLTSIPPAFLALCRWDIFCLHSPGSASTDPRQSQHLQMLCQQRQAMGQAHRGQLHVEAAQDQQRAPGQRPLIPATGGIENHESSAPSRIVISPRVSPKEQHSTCQDVKKHCL